MDDTLNMDDVQQARGLPVYSSDDEKIGVVQDIYADLDTGRPEWVGVGTGFFRTKHVLVPVQGARIDEAGYHVPYTKDHVKDAPDIDEDEIGRDAEAGLYEYYGLEASGRDVTPSAGPAEGVEEGSMVRSEEELRVGKRSVDAGKVRLRKWVETEPVQEEVELRREKARVEREPIDRPAAQGEIGEQEIEVPLQAEEAVVSKEAVAKERISVEKDVETQTQTVDEELRRERVEIEGEDTNR